jgi:hypothetical protein
LITFKSAKQGCWSTIAQELHLAGGSWHHGGNGTVQQPVDSVDPLAPLPMGSLDLRADTCRMVSDGRSVMQRLHRRMVEIVAALGLMGS